MSGTTLSNRYHSGITLTNPATQNPTTLTSYIYTNTGAAILGTAGTAWTVSNQGLLIDYGQNTVSGGGGKEDNSGSVNNPGGIDLLSGGLVINGNTGPGGQGQIRGGGPFYATGLLEEETVGIAISGGTGKVVNYGSIKSAYIGVSLAGGGTILNGSSADTIASINAVLLVNGGAGLIGNYGTIGHGGLLGGNGIVLTDGGLVANAASGYLRSGTTITGAAGTIFNAGTMNHSVRLEMGGTLDNLAGGRVAYGAYFDGAAATLLNAGRVSGAVTFGSAGSVSNTGTISGGSVGVAFTATGAVTNGQSGSAAGLISGGTMGLTIAGAGGLLVNFGEIVSGEAGVQFGGAGSISNFGTITETGGYKSGAAVLLPAGGTLVNSGTLAGSPFGAEGTGATIGNTGVITATGIGRATAIGLVLGGGIATNSSAVTGSGEYGVGALLGSGANLVNSGLVAGTAGYNIESASPVTEIGFGAYVTSGATILNTGTILGTVASGKSFSTAGILVTGTVGVSITNLGTVIGGDGIFVQRSERIGSNGQYSYIDPKPNVTVVDAGLIDGTAGLAAQFGDGTNRLVVQPGASFAGSVSGGTGSNTLEFATGTGILNGLGSLITNFSTLDVDAGANWQVSGSLSSGVTLTNDGTLLANTATLIDSTPLLAATGSTGTIEVAGHGVAELLSTVAANQTARFVDLVGTLEIGTLGGFAGTIAGFAGGDTIALLGVTASSVAYANHQLTISNGTTVLGKLAVATNFTGDTFTVTDSGGNSDITTNAPCFAAGTRLRTVAGDVAVERLQPGMDLVTASGAPGRVRWLGHRRVDCRRHKRPDLVRPIEVAAHAFGTGLPARTLRLSPDHAVFADGVLIPVQHLANGRSIRQVAVPVVEYWHVELEHHAVIFAEGLPAESYLDTGNRTAFANGGAFLELHPDFRPKSWGEACAELVQDGPRLVAARRRLFDRTVAPPALTLAVVAGRRALAPQSLAPGLWRYRLPPGVKTLALRSPTWVPAHCRAEALDRRRLGVRISAIAFDGAACDPARFGRGFHPVETTAEGPCRWTTGLACVPVPPGAGCVEIRIEDHAQPVPGPGDGDKPGQRRDGEPRQSPKKPEHG